MAKELRIACQAVHGEVEGTCENKCEDFSSWFSMKCIGFVRNGKQFISAEIYPLITSKNN